MAKTVSKKQRYSLCLVIIILLVCCYLARRGFSGLDARIFFDIYHWPNALRSLFLVCTFLGSLTFTTLLFIGFILKKRYAIAVRFMWASALTFLVVTLVKQTINRPRPNVFFGVIARDHGATGAGFPSGHTAQATIVAFALWPLVPKRLRPFVILGVFAVGLSRIYLGVHSPLDVIGGACIGALVGFSAQQLALLTRLEKHKAKA